MLILIAGPYRSGTNDDPEKIEANVRVMETFVLPVFKKGHLPVTGEWLALPLVKLAGSTRVGDEKFREFFHPVAERLINKCDAVLRIGGASLGADLMVAMAKKRGLKVYFNIDDVPEA